MKAGGRYIVGVQGSVRFAYALSKARKDIEQLAIRRGYKRIAFRASDSAHGNVLLWAGFVFASIWDWLRLLASIESNSMVLVQYPHFPLKSVLILRVMLPIVIRLKRCRVVALVHDLDSVRGVNGVAARYSDRRVLKRFSWIVCHNERMRDELIRLGVCEQYIIPLGVFDYLCDDTAGRAKESVRTEGVRLAFAGNLSPEKSSFLYQMAPLLGESLTLLLYGSGYCIIKSLYVCYGGVVSAERLPLELEADYGLVWDGDSIETCSGAYGGYLALNNPHKVSLYLSAGIPVIIWSGAALAGYIERGGLGICIESLRDLGHALAATGKEQYEQMRQNAEREGERIRNGYYFNMALDRVEAQCFKS